MKNIFTAIALSASLYSLPAFAVSSADFSLNIPNGKEKSSGYVHMKHDQKYKICMRNSSDVKADADVKIDGKDVGVWRVKAGKKLCINRPANDTGRFTFYKSNSYEAHLSNGSSISNGDKGVISVTFYPEKIKHYDVTPYGNYHADSMPDILIQPRGRSSISSGVTGLSGHSNQKFKDAHNIDRDYSRQVTLELRLVHDKVLERPSYNNGPRPLQQNVSVYAPPPAPSGYGYNHSHGNPSNFYGFQSNNRPSNYGRPYGSYRWNKYNNYR